MRFLDFLSKNWSQITVVIAAIGYLLKVILDFNIRKKEIKFEYLYKEKAGSFQGFLICYQNFKTLLIQEAYKYKHNGTSFSEFEITMNNSKKELEEKLNFLIMYCSNKEKESLYSILNSCTFVLYEIKKTDTDGVEQALEETNKKNKVIIEKLVKNFNL
ncbi:hypothetical protein SAMN04488128_1011150 [Chitinophaga eiseniae]|uniref:Uncharacterized protein n=1 Tax=Chitinophaga eiseniae TaxID=634771 RepID=A0A1T4MLF5_9BACT|nr:hypothetical protein [Chitinophaga eiseniae]SJZ67604.1 hypothetical protein SAMN04488128_1011150 [Chitinophaga eiseniae]